jgi:hypothetical protein
VADISAVITADPRFRRLAAGCTAVDAIHAIEAIRVLADQLDTERLARGRDEIRRGGRAQRPTGESAVEQAIRACTAGPATWAAAVARGRAALDRVGRRQPPWRIGC